MDANVLIKAGIDYDDALRRCAGDADFYETLLGMFLEDSNFREAKKHLAEGDFEALFPCVHERKGMSGNLSITNLYRSSSNVVALLRAGESEAITSAFAELEDAYQIAVDAIVEARR